MKRGKRICSELKAVRRRIADENGIGLHQDECKHTGDCLGTCPKCEAEVRYLEQALTHRIATGRAATVAGLTLSLAACGGTAEPTLTVDTPLNVLPADTTCGSDSLMNPETDVPCPDIPVPGDIVVLGFTEREVAEQDTDKNELIEGEIGPANEAIKEKVLDGEAEIYVFPDEYPSYPGGEEAMYDFINKNLQYPEGDRCITGTVVIRFVVEKDGSISNVSIAREIGGGCGKEVVRVVKMMPKWNPGKKNGKEVRSEFTLPVKFQLN
ncbi:MAG: energy transducer TonB [Bacteroidales bacterium]|nr:energy transducer TonB [Bacteroidales bacterium]